jgi:hypothetical protein
MVGVSSGPVASWYLTSIVFDALLVKKESRRYSDVIPSKISGSELSLVRVNMRFQRRRHRN